MKEIYLTVTEMTFHREGRVIGHGRTISAATGPERPSEQCQRYTEGILKLGVFRAEEKEALIGRWSANFEGEGGYSLTFRGDRFVLGYFPRRERQMKASQQ